MILPNVAGLLAKRKTQVSDQFLTADRRGRRMEVGSHVQARFIDQLNYANVSQ